MAGTAQEVFDRFSPGPTYILKSSKEQLKKTKYCFVNLLHVAARLHLKAKDMFR